MIMGPLRIAGDPQAIDEATILGNLNPLDVVEYGWKAMMEEVIQYEVDFGT